MYTQTILFTKTNFLTDLKRLKLYTAQYTSLLQGYAKLLRLVDLLLTKMVFCSCVATFSKTFI